MQPKRLRAAILGLPGVHARLTCFSLIRNIHEADISMASTQYLGTLYHFAQTITALIVVIEIADTAFHNSG
jgi:hypothetical protein